MNRLAILCVCIAVCARAGAADLAACRDALPQWRTPVKDLAGELPAADYLDTIIDCNIPGGHSEGALRLPPPPRSEWLDSEQRLYREVLAKKPVDILIVPFQVQWYGLDRIERSLMTAELAYAIGDASDYTVADPFLVARALGEGMRRVDATGVDHLARTLGAKWIITGYVGHDLHHAFTLTLQVKDVSPQAQRGPARLTQHDWRNIAFTDERTPALVFNDMLPDVLHALPLRPAAPKSSTPTSTTVGSRITQTPRELVTTRAGATTAAFDLLGALGSSMSELSREREFERALLISLRSGSGQTTERFFRAYALSELARRPAALATLAGQSTPEAVALKAVLDGDLPSAEQAVAKVPQSLQRLLLDAAVRDLEGTYGRKLRALPVASQETFGIARAHWQSLVQLRAQDNDAWALDDPLVIKGLLDEIYPIAGLDVASILRGNTVAHAAAPDEIEVDLTNERHVRRAAAEIEPSKCCTTRSLRPTQWDLLWVLEGRADSRIFRNLWHQTHLQGLPRDALQQLSRYDPLLRGQPLLELARSQAAVSMFQGSSDDTRANWLTQTRQSAAVAAYYSPGQNAIASEALINMGIPSPQSQYMVDAYGYDYPRRPFWNWWSFAVGSQPELVKSLLLQGLLFSSDNVQPLKDLPTTESAAQVDAVIASLGTRFTGAPDRPELSFDSARSTAQERMAHLQAAIQRDPQNWANYVALGEYIVTSGNPYERARDAFLKYPGFRDPHPQDPVGLSNDAFEGGSLLYLQGMTGLAQPLYKIAADLNTGSEGSLTSQARLLMLQRDYVGAAAILLERADRYESPYSYRDYLSLLHAFGQSEAAWQAFSQVKASFRVPQVWVSALVGQELKGLRNPDVRHWLLQPEIRDAQFHNYRFAPYYAVLWSATDHEPDEDLGKLVEQLEGPPTGRIDVDGHTLLQPMSGMQGYFEPVQASPLRLGKSPALPPQTPIKSSTAYFADAYAALRRGEYATAVARFVAMADRYPIEGYPLAYFAYAAAKTGDPEHLETYLQSRGRVDFDSWLAKAFFAAGRHDNPAALAALQSAFRSRPNTDFRPVLSEYQYAEACEWLLKDTGDLRFRQALLDWVRKHQVIQPAQGWAYAMQYTYEPPSPERTRALAMARYLDPASDRIQSASKAEIDAATAWFNEHNPFNLTAPKGQKSSNVVAAPLRHSSPRG